MLFLTVFSIATTYREKTADTEWCSAFPSVEAVKDILSGLSATRFGVPAMTNISRPLNSACSAMVSFVFIPKVWSAMELSTPIFRINSEDTGQLSVP